MSSTAQRGILEQHAGLPISVYLNKPICQDELLDAVLRPFVKEPSCGDSNNDNSPSKMRRNRKVSVLVAEDNPVNQQVATNILQKLAYRVTIAANGLQAVSHVERENFDLVLMDIEMPVMNGFEASRKIRDIESRQGRRTPIIAMSVNIDQEYKDRIVHNGIDGYIPKPIQLSNLRQCLQDCLKKEKNVNSEYVQTVMKISDTLSGEEHQQAKKRILLAEDNIVNQKLAIRLLEKFGYSVTTAENGASKSSQLTVHLIFLP